MSQFPEAQRRPVLPLAGSVPAAGAQRAGRQRSSRLGPGHCGKPAGWKGQWREPDEVAE